MNCKIIDCITFFDNNLMFDLRYNILKNYVDCFIICESKFDHKNRPKKINFKQFAILNAFLLRKVLSKTIPKNHPTTAFPTPFQQKYKKPC